MRILKEYNHLKILDDHPNVVRYYDWWFEKNTDRSHEKEHDLRPEEVSSDREWRSENDDSEDENTPSQKTHNSHKTSNGQKTSIDQKNRLNTNSFDHSNQFGSSEFNPTENISIHENRPKPHIWQICITMQLCAQNLSQFIKNRNRNIKKVLTDSDDYKTSKHIFKQIVNGLKYVHDHNIIHRDIKPANIFFCENADFGGNAERVMIGDFGLSTSSEVNQGFGDVLERDLIKSKSMITAGENTNVQFFSNNVGTTSYAAPEQLNSRVYTKQADLYPLGLILLELMIPFLTGSERAIELMLARKSNSIFEKEFDRLAWPNHEVRCLVGELLQNDPKKRITDTDKILENAFFESQETRDYEEKMDKVMRQNADLKIQVSLLTKRNQELERLLAKARIDKIGETDKSVSTARKYVEETLVNSCEEKLMNSPI
jgi:serine/threonine protein kinase